MNRGICTMCGEDAILDTNDECFQCKAQEAEERRED
jgi:hypothetical protein